MERAASRNGPQDLREPPFSANVVLVNHSQNTLVYQTEHEGHALGVAKTLAILLGVSCYNIRLLTSEMHERGVYGRCLHISPG